MRKEIMYLESFNHGKECYGYDMSYDDAIESYTTLRSFNRIGNVSERQDNQIAFFDNDRNKTFTFTFPNEEMLEKFNKDIESI